MYHIPYYKAKDQKEVIDFMHSHPFVTLIGCDDNKFPVATHLPVLIEERNGKLYLQAHIQKQTDHHKAYLHNPKVLAIFTGPHAYISASWYANQQQASTWNYQAVHAKGNLQFLPDEDLLPLLTKQTMHFENNPSSPALVNQLNPDYVSKHMKAIIAFEVEITELAHVFKLSQNRDEEDRAKIIARLQTGDYEAKQVAAIMQASRKL